MMIYVGICRETWECFLVFMKEHILPGTRIMSDMWKAYDCLQDECHVHVTVNHSLNFVEPDTGALHRKLRAPGGLPRTRRTKDHYNSYLTEWLWRRNYKNCDSFLNLLSA